MRLLALTCLTFAALLPALQAGAADVQDRRDLLNRRPMSLEDVVTLKSLTPPSKQELEEAKKNQNTEMRVQALKDAGMSYGARSGLAFRTWEIRMHLVDRAAYLDRVFDFNRLMIKAPSGLMIEPPIITEAEAAMKIENGGQVAAVADKVYNINRDAQISPVARNWRTYMERDWGETISPPSILYPVSVEEKKAWADVVRRGWDEGVKQADEIFQADLDRLTADYNGMVRYRVLLAQNMVSAPYALQIDRGVTGGGHEMRVGDRAVQITGPSVLMSDSATWQPADR